MMQESHDNLIVVLALDPAFSVIYAYFTSRLHSIKQHKWCTVSCALHGGTVTLWDFLSRPCHPIFLLKIMSKFRLIMLSYN